MDHFYGQWLSITRLQVPTVAFIEGPAIGAGAAVALACDIRWVGNTARFSVPFTRLGLHAGMGRRSCSHRRSGRRWPGICC
jgi:enoyl-CoA hydratase